MTEVEALYFHCKCLTSLLGLESCGYGAFAYKKAVSTQTSEYNVKSCKTAPEKYFLLKKSPSNFTNPSIGNLAEKVFSLGAHRQVFTPSLIPSQEGQKSFS